MAIINIYDDDKTSVLDSDVENQFQKKKRIYYKYYGKVSTVIKSIRNISYIDIDTDSFFYYHKKKLGLVRIT